MIIDCFLFHDELEMLDFRLAELREAVAYHVLVEAPLTSAGRKKELYFKNNRDRYKRYASKIVHIVVNDMPGIDPQCLACHATHNGAKYIKAVWEQEYHQRRCIDRGLRQLKLGADDLVILADCDEIPDPETLKHYHHACLKYGLFALEQDFYYYNLTCKHMRPWDLSRMFNYGYFVRMGRDCQKMRVSKPTARINRGGWHFSYFGGPETISRKLDCFSEQTHNRSRNRDKNHIQHCINECKDFLGRPGETFVRTPIESNRYLPKYYQMLP